MDVDLENGRTNGTDYEDKFMMSAPLAYSEDEMDEVDVGGTGISNRNNFRRPPQTVHRPGTARPETIPLLNKPIVKPEKLDAEEIDINTDNRPDNDSKSHPGVDDGFFQDNGQPSPPHPDYNPYPGGPFPSLPYDPLPDPSMPDVNVYQHKKTLAQGLMDLALVSANANQLRYVLESSNRHPYYHFSLGLIITSLVIQVVVGVGLIWNSQYNIKHVKEIHHANRINNITMILIFLLTFVNVFITAFGVAEYTPQN